MREVWVVRYDECDEEGRSRGRGRTIGIFESERAARAAAVGKGDWNGNGIVAQRFVGDDNLLYERCSKHPVVMGLHEDPKAIKARALAKLTPEERAALGIK